MPIDIIDYQKVFNIGDAYILPQQTGQSRWLPEQRMLQVLLINALDDARLSDKEFGMPRDRAYKRFVDQRRALAWIYAPGDHVYGFEWVCQHLNLNPENVRKMMRGKVPRAAAIEKHLLDPENVPAPVIPDGYKVFVKRGTAAIKGRGSGRHEIPHLNSWI